VLFRSWNEWAEGATLEPDAHHGYAWLSATRRALENRHALTSCCIVVHAWYAREFAELLDALHEARLDLPLMVTTSTEQRGAIEEVLRRCGAVAEIHEFENRGRDILPFLRLAPSLIAAGYSFVLKLHTKRSPHLADGAHWRRAMTHSLLSQPLPVIRYQFAPGSDVGLMAPTGQLAALAAHWGGNESELRAFGQACGVALEDVNLATFPAGSMYWVRLAALEPLLYGPLRASEFAPEAGQIDGTAAHVVERSIGLSVNLAGFRMIEMQDIRST